MEAISHAGAAVGVRTDEGVVLAAEKKILSKLLETSVASEKMHKLDDHLGVAVAGINSDANILINSARLSAQRYLMTYQEPVPMEQLVQTLCDQKQGYTQYGGLRPFGVSFLFGGGDKKRKAPSGGGEDREDSEGGERCDDGEWGGRGTPRKSGREPTRRSSRQQGVAADPVPGDLPDDDGASARRHKRGMNATEEDIGTEPS